MDLDNRITDNDLELLYDNLDKKQLIELSIKRLREIEELNKKLTVKPSSLQLPYSKNDLSRAYQAGCLDNVDDSIQYSEKDLKELKQESLEWIEGWTK